MVREGILPSIAGDWSELSLHTAEGAIAFPPYRTGRLSSGGTSRSHEDCRCATRGLVKLLNHMPRRCAIGEALLACRATTGSGSASWRDTCKRVGASLPPLRGARGRVGVGAIIVVGRRIAARRGLQRYYPSFPQGVEQGFRLGHKPLVKRFGLARLYAPCKGESNVHLNHHSIQYLLRDKHRSSRILLSPLR